ncbi:MAG: glycosyltransferase family 4 protein [Candidatus Brocadiae bacterium]|nr:glycosyltransferase family 4 protein [Candidatus Brocadiia bacterium]
MKIAIDCRSVFPGRGGIGRYAENLGKRLPEMEREQEYIILTTERQKEKICGRQNAQQWPFACGMIDAFWEQMKLPGILEENEIGLYHNPCFSLPIAREKTKLIATIHDVVFRERADLVEARLCEYLDRWTEVACKVADRIITVSEYSKRQVIKYYGVEDSKIEVIYNGIENKFQKADKYEQERVKKLYGLKDFVLYLGAMEPKKNLDCLLDAMRIVKEKFPECQVAIAGGKGPQEYDIKKAIRIRRLENTAVVTGYVDEKDVTALLSAARVFVYPSVYEGFGFPPLEAMACETATIVSDATSLPEVVGEGAWIVGKEDREGMAKAIERLLSDREEARAYSIKGKQRSRLFTWEKCIKKTWELYKKVI